MNLLIESPPVPLAADGHGVIRVGGSRVPLDTVVYAFNQGASPEEIVLNYPSLNLADVYSVINYYLHNRIEVDAYVSQREAESARIRGENERRFPPDSVRARLLARRDSKV